VTEGVDLNALAGKEFLIGEVRIRGIRLCEPCTYLARSTFPETLKGWCTRAVASADPDGGFDAGGGRGGRALSHAWHRRKSDSTGDRFHRRRTCTLTVAAGSIMLLDSQGTWDSQKDGLFGRGAFVMLEIGQATPVPPKPNHRFHLRFSARNPDVRRKPAHQTSATMNDERAASHAENSPRRMVAAVLAQPYPLSLGVLLPAVALMLIVPFI